MSQVPSATVHVVMPNALPLSAPLYIRKIVEARILLLVNPSHSYSNKAPRVLPPRLLKRKEQ